MTLVTLHTTQLDMIRLLSLVGDHINEVPLNTIGLALPLLRNCPLVDAYYQVHKWIITITELVRVTLM